MVWFAIECNLHGRTRRALLSACSAPRETTNLEIAVRLTGVR